MDKRIVIIGSGLAGSIAYEALRAYKPQIIEARSKPKGDLNIHPAVMRLRNPAVADAIGAKAEKITVSKAIFYKGEIHNRSTIRFNNLYSRKVYDCIGRRSLNRLGDVERYIINGYPQPENTLWDHKVSSIDDGYINCLYRSSPGYHKRIQIPYDICISTLSMEVLCNGYNRNSLESANNLNLMNRLAVVGCPAEFGKIEFKSTPIYVLRKKLEITSNIHQTLYFPDPETNIYRITIQNQDVIIEATSKCEEADGLTSDAFGIGINDFESNPGRLPAWKKIEIGKIVPLEEDDRLRYIMWLTDEHNIFSFGRFATWRPLRTDHLLKDIAKIKRVISASDIGAKYKSRL